MHRTTEKHLYQSSVEKMDEQEDQIVSIDKRFGVDHVPRFVWFRRVVRSLPSFENRMELVTLFLWGWVCGCKLVVYLSHRHIDRQAPCLKLFIVERLSVVAQRGCPLTLLFFQTSANYFVTRMHCNWNVDDGRWVVEGSN